MIGSIAVPSYSPGMGNDVVSRMRIAGSVPKDKELYRYGEEKWSVREIFGHLVDAERFFGHRAFCVSRSDPNPLPGFDEKLYIEGSSYDSRPLPELLHDFSLLREANSRHLESLSDDAWPREGIANGARITVRALAYVMTGHVRHHLAVLKERYGIGFRVQFNRSHKVPSEPVVGVVIHHRPVVIRVHFDRRNGNGFECRGVRFGYHPLADLVTCLTDFPPETV